MCMCVCVCVCVYVCACYMKLCVIIILYNKKFDLVIYPWRLGPLFFG
jgi:hypothetical protein